MCTTQAKYGDGVNLSSFFGSSSALVHRKTNFLRLISSATITSICGCISGSPPAMDTIGAPHSSIAPIACSTGIRCLSIVVRLLDLAAAGALQVAGEQRLELDEQRELLVARAASGASGSSRRAGSDAVAWLMPRTSLGRPNRMILVVVTRSVDLDGAEPAERGDDLVHHGRGAEAPAVRPIVATPRSQPSWMSPARRPGAPGAGPLARSPPAGPSWRSSPTRPRAPGRHRRRQPARRACRLVVA